MKHEILPGYHHQKMQLNKRHVKLAYFSHVVGKLNKLIVQPLTHVYMYVYMYMYICVWDFNMLITII